MRERNANGGITRRARGEGRREEGKQSAHAPSTTPHGTPLLATTLSPHPPDPLLPAHYPLGQQSRYTIALAQPTPRTKVCRAFRGDLMADVNTLEDQVRLTCYEHIGRQPPRRQHSLQHSQAVKKGEYCSGGMLEPLLAGGGKYWCVELRSLNCLYWCK